VKNYLETDKITKISIRRISDGGIYRTVAVLDVIPEGQKVLVLGKNLSALFNNTVQEMLITFWRMWRDCNLKEE